MKNLFIGGLLSFLCATLMAQEVKVYKIEDLERRMVNHGDTVMVLNFWATWCKPCVAEIPEFEKLNSEKKEFPFKMILVSMDFKEDLEKKLKPFLQKAAYQSEIALLDEVDGNKFIDRIEKNWTGAIPATLILFKEKRKFIGTKTNYEALQNAINELRNSN